MSFLVVVVVVGVIVIVVVVAEFNEELQEEDSFELNCKVKKRTQRNETRKIKNQLIMLIIKINRVIKI